METPNTTQTSPAPEAPVTPSAPKGPSPYLTPAAVVVGAAIIAFALMFGTPTAPDPEADAQVAAEAALENILPISPEDHIRGNPDAPIKIVEYSDTECPFCKQFHVTLEKIMDEYGASGQVAWVYRHLPLDGLHPNARTQAEATECAAELGGEDAFWAYLDTLMAGEPNVGTPLSELPVIARTVGLDVTAFNECVASGRYATKVQSHIDNAVATSADGRIGTPWNIVVTASGEKTPISGAYPYEYVKQVIDTALAAE